MEGQRLRKADIPTTAEREGHTNGQTKSHSDAQDKETHGHGHGATRHGTAQNSTGEQCRQGDSETTLTFRALRGNHNMSIPFETIGKKKKTGTWKISYLNNETKIPRKQQQVTNRQTDGQTDGQPDGRRPSTARKILFFYPLLSLSHILDSYVFLYSLYLPDTIEQFNT